ncbi:MAG: polysaccharide deacetylase family protein [Pseudomonadota bacterium]
MLDWSPLRAAITQDTQFWWRDDDAVADTPQLNRLIDLSQSTRCAVHLAVIPGHLHGSLPPRVAAQPGVIPLVHGWAHKDTSAPNAKTSEFVTARPEAISQLSEGLKVLEAAFSGRLMRVFVPPWNRISDDIAHQLAALGYAALSTFGPRDRQADVGITRINTHIDPIDWRGTRGLTDPQMLIDQAAAQLRAYPNEPIGLLTHHLVHDDAIWDMSERVLHTLLDGGAAPLDVQGLLDEPT